MDNLSRYSEAVDLYDDALQFVVSSVDAIENRPRVIFCSSLDCFQSFGFNGSSANTVGTSGVVIGPHEWKDYYVRHEMIHHLQAERMGVLRQWRSPVWFKEGMAYSLSQDPRANLSEPQQQYRSDFEKWHPTVETRDIWEAAREL